MSINIKSKNGLRTVLVDENGKTKTFLFAGASKVPSEAVLNVCQSFNEVDFVMGLQKAGNMPADILAYINSSNLELPRIKALMQVANFAGADEQLKNDILSAVAVSRNGEMGEKISEKLSESSEVSKHIGESLSFNKDLSDRKISGVDAKFTETLAAFLETFKTNYLANYYDDIKLNHEKGDKEFTADVQETLSSKLQVLSDALVSNFRKQYLNHVIGKNYTLQLKLAKERDARSEIIKNEVEEMLNSVLVARIKALNVPVDKLPENIRKIYEKSANIEKIQAQNVNRAKKDEEQVNNFGKNNAKPLIAALKNDEFAQAVVNLNEIVDKLSLIANIDETLGTTAENGIDFKDAKFVIFQSKLLLRNFYEDKENNKKLTFSEFLNSCNKQLLKNLTVENLNSTAELLAEKHSELLKKHEKEIKQNNQPGN